MDDPFHFSALREMKKRAGAQPVETFDAYLLETLKQNVQGEQAARIKRMGCFTPITTWDIE